MNEFIEGTTERASLWVSGDISADAAPIWGMGKFGGVQPWEKQEELGLLCKVGLPSMHSVTLLPPGLVLYLLIL